MTRNDYFIIIGLAIVFLVGIFILITSLSASAKQCLANPLVYGAKQITDQYGYEFTGQGFLIIPGSFQQVSFIFNSTNLTIFSK